MSCVVLPRLLRDRAGCHGMLDYPFTVQRSQPLRAYDRRRVWVISPVSRMGRAVRDGHSAFCDQPGSWLAQTGLLGVQFDSRRDALAAFAVACALTPSPRLLVPQLRRVASGVYRSRCGRWTVRRVMVINGKAVRWDIHDSRNDRWLMRALSIPDAAITLAGMRPGG